MTLHAIKILAAGLIKKPEEPKQKWDFYEHLETVAGDDSFRPIAEDGCPIWRIG